MRAGPARAASVDDAFTRPYYPDCGDCVNPRVTLRRDHEREQGEPDMRVFRGAWCGRNAWYRRPRRGRWSRVEPAFGIGFRCAADG
ncbi:hypothetical protein EON77_13155 [bacterium]|nr:MAG: hypothetical protein EON77_13155 [bacterium]